MFWGLYETKNALFSVERDPKKRRVKPVETQASILDFDLEESSDDSDFRIEDHPEVSDDDDDSMDSNAGGGGMCERVVGFFYCV